MDSVTADACVRFALFCEDRQVHSLSVPLVWTQLAWAVAALVAGYLVLRKRDA